MIVGYSRVFGFPSNTGHLKIWLKADAITGYSDGDRLTIWTDQSGNGNDFFAGTGPDSNKPKYKTTSVTINGLPVVKFNEDDPGETGNVMSRGTAQLNT